MRYFLETIIVLCLLVASNDLIGCSCGKIPSIDKYDYIALVKITGIVKSDLYEPGKINEPPKPIFHEIKVKAIEQFKGDEQKFLIIHGGNNKYNMGWTSCDMGIEIGEEWIIYGTKFKNRISSNYCTHSTQHKNLKQETDFKYNRSMERLKELRGIFKPKEIEDKLGKIELNYLNRGIKLREEYDSNNNLNGIRQAYFRNGQIMVNENYSDGLKDGDLIWYFDDGKIHRTSTFRAGKEICETYYYNYLGNLKRINYFDDEGNSIGSQKMPDDNK